MIDSNELKKLFGNAVKKLRELNKLTQEELAERVGVQTQTITRIETGRNFVSSELLIALCNVFEVEPNIFFSRRLENFSQNDIDYISKIKRMLPSFENAKLQEIYNILLAMKK